MTLTHEPPHGTRQPQLYTAAAPFAEAIHTWVKAYVSWKRAQPFHWLWTSDDENTYAVRRLAERAGMSRHVVMATYDGSRDTLSLRQADMLAIALDIPLPLLADEFRPLQAWKKP
jgi:hypothetical protein